jgi:di/tricarboxylate transporter
VAFEGLDPESPLNVGDVLWFSGPAHAVGDLRKIPGLVQYQNEQVEQIKDRIHDRRLMQAVIARNSPLVGKTVKEMGFRTRYGAAVIAVHREGQRVHEHPGNVKLQAGDVLLLEAGPTFMAKSAQNDRAFALLAEVKNSAPPRLALLLPALFLAAAMLVVYTTGLSDLLTAALVASFLMVVLGILSEQELREALNWDVYLAVAAAFGIGTALVNSGVAGGVAGVMVGIGNAVGMGDAGLLGAVYLATFLISSVVTNNAAAALMFPVAMDAAEQTGIDLKIMSFCVMLGASASFMTPFGYTTNLLIYGPGGYKYNDFLFFGTPMQIVLWVLSTVFLVTGDQWYISWISMIAFLVGASMFRIVPSWLDLTK